MRKGKTNKPLNENWALFHAAENHEAYKNIAENSGILEHGAAAELGSTGFQ